MKYSDHFYNELLRFLTPILSDESYRHFARPYNNREDERENNYAFFMEDITVRIQIYMITHSNCHEGEYEDNSYESFSDTQYGTEIIVLANNKIVLYDLVRYQPMTIPYVMKLLNTDRHQCADCGRWMLSKETYCCSCYPFVVEQGLFGTCRICETDREGVWVVLYDTDTDTDINADTDRIHQACAMTHYRLKPNRYAKI